MAITRGGCCMANRIGGVISSGVVLGDITRLLGVKGGTTSRMGTKFGASRVQR